MYIKNTAKDPEIFTAFLYRLLENREAFSSSTAYDGSQYDDWDAEESTDECVAYDSHWRMDQLDLFRICYQ